jgi:hypothetical protein
MATTERATSPRSKHRPNVIGGFGYLTLNPAPRLGRIRTEMTERNQQRDPWRDVARALSEAIEAVKTTRLK